MNMLTVGALLGASVGVLVGVPVAAVGAAAGVSVGAFVGVPVGASVGVTVGKCVSPAIVGVAVGAAEGAAVGVASRGTRPVRAHGTARRRVPRGVDELNPAVSAFCDAVVSLVDFDCLQHFVIGEGTFRQS